MTTRRRPLIFTLLAAILGAAVAHAQAAAPPAVQATTFAKILSFDRALDKSKTRILLIHDLSTGKDQAAVLQQAFTAAGLAAEAVPVGNARNRLEPGVVAYLLPGTVSSLLLDSAAAAHVLTIAGDPSLAEQGKVSVGLGMRGDKPDIVVNLGRVATEGHDFAAQLLSFARVIRADAGAAEAAASSAPETMQPPVLVGLTKPEYPALARKMQVQGDVVMRLSVDASGKVTNVEMVKPIGRGGLDEAAMAAAKGARFKPATRNGAAVPGTYLLTMPFRL